MKYCRECGDRLTGADHVCSEAGLNAMRRNPILALLIRDDGTPNRDAPVILGGGPKTAAREQ